MYLFEIRGIKCPCKNESYLPKAKLPKKIKGISAHITTAFLNTKCVYTEKSLYMFLLLEVQTNAIVATTEFEHLNKSN